MSISNSRAMPLLVGCLNMDKPALRDLPDAAVLAPKSRISLDQSLPSVLLWDYAEANRSPTGSIVTRHQNSFTRAVEVDN
jgi:hypothetical protein